MARKPFRRKKIDVEDPAALQSEIDVVLRVLAQYPPDTRISFGAPVRCPSCANFGLVEHVNPAAGVSVNHCVACGLDWVMTIRGMRAAREAVSAWSFGPTPAAPVFDTAPPATHGGVLFSRGSSGELSRQILDPAGQPLEAPADLALPDERLSTPRQPMRVLLVEDDQSDIEVVKALLDPVGDVIDLRWAKTRKEGEEAARLDEPDLVLLDLGLPDSHGFQTVTQWHFNAVDAPVLVVSGEYGSEIVDRGRELGITGFIDKSELADLLAAGDDGTTAFVDRLESAATV